MSTENPVIRTIKTRRSIRQFKKDPVPDEILDQILESGLWAPSGKNNQPWKFAVIRDPATKESLATFTHYSSVINHAPACIAVFLDYTRVYERTKDVLAVGASIQNMLLTIHALGLVGVWLGEILKNKDNVRELLGADQDLELMAVVALGYPSRKTSQSSVRDRLEEKVFSRK
jgi:nitroreductase